MARLVLADVAPEQEPYLEVTATRIFAGDPAARRAIRASLTGPGRSNPTSFGAEEASFLVGFLLSVLNGVAVQVLAGKAIESAGALRARWHARRQRRALAAATAPKALATALPTLTAVEAAQVGKEVMRLATKAGIAEEQAQRMSTLIASALMAGG